MPTDFHHAVTHVTAGFGHDPANIIAQSGQYMKAAAGKGVGLLHNNGFYSGILSLHENTDVVHLNNGENHTICLPFHCLPANRSPLVLPHKESSP